MTPTELKESLIKQYNDTVVTIQKLEGAIYACEQLIQKETEEEETTDDD